VEGRRRRGFWHDHRIRQPVVLRPGNHVLSGA
jgi:hypothetical protein